MPGSSFHALDDGELNRDAFGVECDGFEGARAQARALLPDITKERRPDGALHKIRCDVRDGAGRVV